MLSSAPVTMVSSSMNSSSFSRIKRSLAAASPRVITGMYITSSRRNRRRVSSEWHWLPNSRRRPPRWPVCGRRRVPGYSGPETSLSRPRRRMRQRTKLACAFNSIVFRARGTPADAALISRNERMAKRNVVFRSPAGHAWPRRCTPRHAHSVRATGWRRGSHRAPPWPLFYTPACRVPTGRWRPSVRHRCLPYAGDHAAAQTPVWRVCGSVAKRS